MTEVDPSIDDHPHRAQPAPAARRPLPRRLLLWRSPQGQPRWARPALLAVAAVAAVLYAWNITSSGYAMYYSVAVKSMSVSWHALLYGALDPAGTVTIDKLAGSFVPQALSARIFGYHQWSLTLPQVVEGVVAVLAMYRIGRRWLGAVAGLLAAGIFALTPVLASMFGHPMEDGLLTMCLVLAADAFQGALVGGRLRHLVWAGVWVGVGFQAKMLQAWMVLPAMAVTYLVAGPPRLRRRFGQLGVAGLVMLAVSVSWVGLYTLTPAHDRPYVDGSTNNSAVAMVFGYNGLDRFGVHVPGAVRSMFTSVGSGGTRPGGPGAGRPGPAAQGPGRHGSGLQGPGRQGPGAPRRAGARVGGPGPGGGQDATTLVGSRFAGQIGWLYPLALLSLAYGLLRFRRRRRADRSRSGFLLWGLWLVTFAAVFSHIRIPHTAYLASLAPPLAALSAAGIVLSWRGFRDRSAPWLLPVAVAAELVWSGYLTWRFYPEFLPWLGWLAVGAGLVSLVVLVGAAMRRATFEGRRSTVLRAAMALGVASMLLVPAGWAVSVLDPAYAGSAFDASAGPGGRAGPGGAGPGRVAGGPGPGRVAGGPALGNAISPDARRHAATIPNRGILGPSGGTATLSGAQQRTVDYLRAHRAGATYLAATDSWRTAGTYIQATGAEFMPMGGFDGSMPTPTLARVKSLVHAGKLRYFLLGGGRVGGPGARSGGSVTGITAWVTGTCARVPAADYDAGGSGSAASGAFGAGRTILYRCG